jgi:hypothetical protein
LRKIVSAIAYPTAGVEHCSIDAVESGVYISGKVLIEQIGIDLARDYSLSGEINIMFRIGCVTGVKVTSRIHDRFCALHRFWDRSGRESLMPPVPPCRAGLNKVDR